MKNLKTILLAALVSISLLSCKNKTEKALDDMENFVEKWEKKSESKLSADEAKDFREEWKEIEEKYPQKDFDADDFTAEQKRSVESLATRVMALQGKIELSQMGLGE